MCSCNLPIVDEASLPPGVTGISLSSIKKGQFYALLLWAWCINAEKVQAAFKEKTGLDIAENNLATLVKANTAGTDIKVYRVNFRDVITSIPFTDEEYKKSECKVNLVRK